MSDTRTYADGLYENSKTGKTTWRDGLKKREAPRIGGTEVFFTIAKAAAIIRDIFVRNDVTSAELLSSNKTGEKTRARVFINNPVYGRTDY